MERSDGSKETGSVSVPAAENAARQAEFESADRKIRKTPEPVHPKQPVTPAQAQTVSYSKLLLWPPFWFFIFFVLAVSAICYAAFRHHRADVRQEKKEQLAIIANLKVEEITKWREERIGDAKAMTHGTFFSREVGKWIQKGMPPGERRAMILARMESMHNAYGYREVLLFDASGKPILSTLPDAPPPGSFTLEMVQNAIRKQHIVFLEIGSRDEPGITGVIAPLFEVHDGKSKVFGAVFLKVDINHFIFPILKATLLDARSLEMVMARREGNNVLLLNAPATDQGSGFLALPLSNSRLPAAMAVLGNQTEIDGIDYRGVPVFAALRKIPDSELALVVKVNQEEVYASLLNLAWSVAGAITILFTLIGVAMGLWWRNQRTGILLKQSREQAERLALMQHFDYLTKYASDIILLADDLGHIAEANDRALEEYGYDRETLLRLSLEDLHAPESRAGGNAHAIQMTKHVDSLRYETMHRRSDKTTFPVEVSVRFIMVDGKQFEQQIIRNITERKQAELQLLERELQYRTLADSGQALIWASGTDKLCNYFNKVWLEFTGRSMEQEMGNGWAEGVHPDDFQHCLDVYVAAFERREKFSMAYRLRRHDGEYRWVQDDGCPRYDSKGEFIGYIGFCLDVTGRKQVEDELKLQRDNFMRILNAITDGIYIVNRDCDIEYVNPVIEREFGKVDGRKCYAYFHDRAEPCPWCKNNEVFKGNSVRWEWNSGKTGKIYDLFDTPILNPDGSMSKFEIFHDITELKRTEAALRESEERYRSLFENNHTVMLVINPDGGAIVDANPAAVAYYEWPLEELRRKNISDINTLTPDQIHAEMELARAEKRNHFVFRHRRAHGEPRDVEVYSGPIQLRGRLLLYSIVMDITERKQAEEALRKLSIAIEQSPASVVITDTKACIQYVNPQFTEVTGYSAAEAIGQTPRILQSGQTPKETYLELWGKLTSDQSWHGELLNKRKNGELYWEDVHIAPVKNPAGVNTHYVAVKTDITARKQAEAALQESEYRWKFALEGAGDGVWDWNVPNNTVFFSKRWKEMLGYAEDEIGNELDEWKKRIHPDDKAEIFAAIQAYFDGKTPVYVCEHRILCKDNSYKWVLDRGMVVSRSGDGKPLRMIGTHTDITERKEHEEELLALHESDMNDMAVADNIMGHIMRLDGLNDPQIRHFKRPTKQFSGDFIAAARDNNGDLRIMLADVTGHGLQAALFLLPVFRVFNTMAKKGLPVCDIVTELNQTMRGIALRDHFIMAAMAKITRDGSFIEVWNGGIPTAFYVQKNGELHKFRSQHLPLGVVGADAFEATTEIFHAPPGALLLCSDGLTEAENAFGEPFGEARFETVLRTSPPDKLFDNILSALEAHLGGNIAHDDLSMVLAQCGN